MKWYGLQWSMVLFLGTFIWADTFKILAEDLPPFVYNHYGQPKGIAVEVVKKIAQHTKHPQTIQIEKWNKAYNLIRNHRGYILFPMSRTKQREALFKWVGPLLKSTSYLYKRKGSSLMIQSLEDAKRVSDIAVVRNYASQQFLKSLGFANLVPAYHTKDAIRALVFGRVDLADVGDVFLPFRAKQANVDYTLLENTNVKSMEQLQFIAFSKDTPNTVIQQWQNRLDELKNNGTYHTIFQQEFDQALKLFNITK